MILLIANTKNQENKVKGNFFIFYTLISLSLIWLNPIVANWDGGVYYNPSVRSGLVPQWKDQLNITRPRFGDVWHQGEAHNITFVSWYHGPETHTVMEAYTMDFILLYSGETYQEWIIEEGWNELANLSHPLQSQTVYYLWHIPETLPNGKDYQILIRVRSFGELFYDYTSDVFTIGSVSDGISGVPIITVIGFTGLISLALVLTSTRRKRKLNI